MGPGARPTGCRDVGRLGFARMDAVRKVSRRDVARQAQLAARVAAAQAAELRVGTQCYLLHLGSWGGGAVAEGEVLAELEAIDLRRRHDAGWLDLDRAQMEGGPAARRRLLPAEELQLTSDNARAGGGCGDDRRVERLGVVLSAGCAAADNSAVPRPTPVCPPLVSETVESSDL
jgi:hypothetical protein